MKPLRPAAWALLSAIVLAGVATPHGPAEAKKRFAAVGGLAAMHDMRIERGRLCFSDHWHYGESKGKSSKRSAMRSAIASWQDFTDLEYGPRWSNYRHALGRKVKCEISSGSWGCAIEARPCTRR